MKDHKIIINDIAEIKEGVKGLHARADDNKEAAQKVANALVQYKAETQAFEKGQETYEDTLIIKKRLEAKEKQEKWQRWVWIIMGVIAIVSIWAGFYLNDRKREVTTQEITHRIDMTKGIPNLTRGGYLIINRNGLTDSIFVLKDKKP